MLRDDQSVYSRERCNEGKAGSIQLSYFISRRPGPDSSTAQTAVRCSCTQHMCCKESVYKQHLIVSYSVGLVYETTPPSVSRLDQFSLSLSLPHTHTHTNSLHVSPRVVQSIHSLTGRGAPSFFSESWQLMAQVFCDHRRYLSQSSSSFSDRVIHSPGQRTVKRTSPQLLFHSHRPVE